LHFYLRSLADAQPIIQPAQANRIKMRLAAPVTAQRKPTTTDQFWTFSVFSQVIQAEKTLNFRGVWGGKIPAEITSLPPCHNLHLSICACTASIPSRWHRAYSEAVAAAKGDAMPRWR